MVSSEPRAIGASARSASTCVSSSKKVQQLASCEWFKSAPC